MEAENMVHSDSMSPASLGICEKLFRRWELKTSLTEARPDVPNNRPSQYVSGLPVSKTYGRRSDETTTKSIIDLRPRVVLVPRCTDGHPVLEHVLCVMDKLVTYRSPITEHRWVQIGEAVPPDHAPPGITVVAHVSVEVPSRTMESPVGALSSTPPRDSKKAGYSVLLFGP
ncbi:hypothetical protein L3Q82_016696 [Scortum barcoo]|uniref:Uncharacterized protein n=1 Tax=Scortum barcoo TaxID=214431 RepID=A0ACB8X848_9TELE|nr:hypothetical protein L3Q82_016696 [Scortum barcoo]